ncbi:MAG: trypsin-like peptidase domain-containing protein [bacterium]
MDIHSFKQLCERPIVKTILASALTVIVILLITSAVIWRERGRIFTYFARGYAQSVASAEHKNDPKTGLPELQPELPAVFSTESTVENAVQSANPAVVAITISKQVPQYTTSYQNVDPFQQFFGGDGSNPFGNFQFQVPTQTPNGTKEQEVGAGSGFIVSSDGLIVTNRHVVEDKTAKYTVFLSNGKKYDAKVLARDAILDVAVVKIEASGLPYLPLGNSDALKLGQSVIAIGNALGQFQNTISVGVVSGLSRSITAGDQSGSSESLDHVIQTDAAINPGNSGGPLLDLEGHVIGVDTAIVQGSQNIGFALPINSIKTVIDSVRTTGKIVRPYLGIRYQVITPEMKDKNNLTVDSGVIVQKGSDKSELAVIPGSPADKAGIVENDIITEVDGTKLDSDHDLAQMIRAKKVGDSVVLTVLGKGTQKKVTVVLQAAPQE